MLPGLLLGAVLSVSPGPNLAKSVLLTDAVESLGARCLDGSPQRLWLQEASSATNTTKWYIHLMGGGWCTSMDDCTRRAYAPGNCYRGSSNVSCFNSNGDYDGHDFNETMDFAHIPCINGARWGGGLLNNDPATNPLTHDWNKVELQYCDGFSYSGSNDTVARVSLAGAGDDLPLYFRGARNLQAALAHLVAHAGLGDATHLVLSGDSAGGLATYWHADYVASFAPRAALVMAAPDSGFFLADASKPAWPAALRWIAEAGNATGGAGLDASCAAAAAAAGRTAAEACTLPEDVAPHVATPLFVMNSRYDSALDGISGHGGAGNATYVNALGRSVLAHVNATVLAGRPRNAAFLTSCHEHCGQWGQGQRLSYKGKNWDDFNVSIDGLSGAAAFDQWFGKVEAGGAERSHLWLQQARYPCKTCCSGGQE